MCVDRHTCTHILTNPAPSLCLIYTYGQIDSNPDLNTPSRLPQCSKCLAWLQGLLGLLKTKHSLSSQAVVSLTRVSLCLFLPSGFIRNEHPWEQKLSRGASPAHVWRTAWPRWKREVSAESLLRLQCSVSLHYMFSYPELDFIPTCVILFILQCFWTPSFISLG